MTETIVKNRIMIAAPKSGSGKTILTCGLLELLKEEGKEPASFKCGPDYIDPMFHRTVIGVPGKNLDPFFAGEGELCGTVARSEGRTAVLEGVMGIYDGIGGTGKTGSCYEVARMTKTPILLVMDVRGMGATMISVLKGILADDAAGLIKGIVLNRMTAGFFGTMRQPLEEALEEAGFSARLLGYIPQQKELRLESRHLGLKMPGEIEDLKEQVARFAAQIRETVDTGALYGIMEQADPLEAEGPGENAPADGPVLAVARDEAFCFYYEQNLELLKRKGVRIREFSPLHDAKLPDGACGLLLGGGYPELYAKELSGNEAMRTAVREAIEGGMPSLAECGGFMYLFEEMETPEGEAYPMAGLLKGRCVNTGRLNRFGYVTVTPRTDGLLDGPVKGHEFHYYDTPDNGKSCTAEKPSGNRSWPCMHMTEDHLWGYPHLYYPSNEKVVDRFCGKMKEYMKSRR